VAQPRLAALASRALPPAGLLDITPSFIFNQLGPVLSAPISAAHLLDRRPACLRRRTLICGQTEPVTPALNTSGHPYAQKKPPVETGSFFANPGLKTQPR